MTHHPHSKRKSVFIVAEVSANHGKSLSRALAMIREAKKCGADAVKFQTYTPDTLTLNLNKAPFMIRHPKWGGQSLYRLYRDAYTPWEWFKKLKRAADEEGIGFFSTAYDKSSVDFLEDLGVTCHKVASFELVDLPLIEYMGQTQKPLILSTGMATLQEIQEAVKAARRGGARDITLLKCVSSYPADPSEMNLLTIPDLKKHFKTPIGLSDHTIGTGIAVAAVALGATFVEKHFTLSRAMKTADSFFSTEPQEFRDLVASVRMVEKALGNVHYGLTKKEKSSLIFRRSLFAVADIQKGENFTESNVRSIRPAKGLKPKYLPDILGGKAAVNIPQGTPLQWRHVK